jgi:hypothetical protein
MLVVRFVFVFLFVLVVLALILLLRSCLWGRFVILPRLLESTRRRGGPLLRLLPIWPLWWRPNPTVLLLRRRWPFLRRRGIAASIGLRRSKVWPVLV